MHVALQGSAVKDSVPNLRFVRDGLRAIFLRGRRTKQKKQTNKRGSFTKDEDPHRGLGAFGDRMILARVASFGEVQNHHTGPVDIHIRDRLGHEHRIASVRHSNLGFRKFDVFLDCVAECIFVVAGISRTVTYYVRLGIKPNC